MLEQGYYIFLLVVMILMMLMPNRESIHDIQQPDLNRDQTREHSPLKGLQEKLFFKTTFLPTSFLYNRRENLSINFATSASICHEKKYRVSWM